MGKRANLLDENSTSVVDSKDWIAGIAKGLSVMEAFSASQPRMTATQMAESIGMTRTAARRHLLTLAHLDYVQTDGKLYWLSPRVLRLGQAFIESSRLARIAQPVLQKITVGTNEAAFLSILDRDEMVYIARSSPNRTLNTGYVLGAHVDAHVTAAGMLMLALQPTAKLEQWLVKHELKAYTSRTIVDTKLLRAELNKIRNRDWALSEEQLELGYRGVAVPLRNHKGDLVAGLNVTMWIGKESSADAVARVLPILRDAAYSLRNLV